MEKVGQLMFSLESFKIDNLELEWKTSNAEIGSSQMINRGFTANARAIPIRWRCPPENSWG